jgi:hypothetical protein
LDDQLCFSSRRLTFWTTYVPPSWGNDNGNREHPPNIGLLLQITWLAAQEDITCFSWCETSRTLGSVSTCVKHTVDVFKTDCNCDCHPRCGDTIAWLSLLQWTSSKLDNADVSGTVASSKQHSTKHQKVSGVNFDTSHKHKHKDTDYHRWVLRNRNREGMRKLVIELTN